MSQIINLDSATGSMVNNLDLDKERVETFFSRCYRIIYWIGDLGVRLSDKTRGQDSLGETSGGDQIEVIEKIERELKRLEKIWEESEYKLVDKMEELLGLENQERDIRVEKDLFIQREQEKVVVEDTHEIEELKAELDNAKAELKRLEEEREALAVKQSKQREKIRTEINKNLKHNYEVNIEGNWSKSKDEIEKIYLEQGEVIWRRGRRASLGEDKKSVIMPKNIGRFKELNEDLIPRQKSQIEALENSLKEMQGKLTHLQQARNEEIALFDLQIEAKKSAKESCQAEVSYHEQERQHVCAQIERIKNILAKFQEQVEEFKDKVFEVEQELVSLLECHSTFETL